VWHTPQADTLISSSPAAGAGIGISTRSSGVSVSRKETIRRKSIAFMASAFQQIPSLLAVFLTSSGAAAILGPVGPPPLNPVASEPRSGAVPAGNHPEARAY